MPCDQAQRNETGIGRGCVVHSPQLSALHGLGHGLLCEPGQREVALAVGRRERAEIDASVTLEGWSDVAERTDGSLQRSDRDIHIGANRLRTLPGVLLTPAFSREHRSGCEGMPENWAQAAVAVLQASNAALLKIRSVFQDARRRWVLNVL